MYRTLLLLLLLPIAAQPAPEAAATAFYATLQTAKVSGLPNAKQERAIAPQLSEALKAVLRQADQKQTACSKKFPDDKPRWVEGDLFSSNFEGFTKVKILPGNQPGHVTAEFQYETVTWKDEIVLKLEKGKWVIDDVFYRGKPEETLRKSLAQPGC